MSERIAVTAAVVWPDDAEDVEEGVVANWFAREGATVDEGETVVEVQVEKVSVDVPAPASGRLVDRAVEENETFDRSDPLAYVEP